MSEFQVIEPGSISESVWHDKYRFKRSDGTPIDKTIYDTFVRVADAISAAERSDDLKDDWGHKFYKAMANFEFLPAGRILAGAGTDRGVTLFNCFVMGEIPDSLDGIFEAVKQGAMTMKKGGGIGMDFSTIRPRGAPVKSVGSGSSGAVSFMRCWDTMCETIMSAGARRGAMMACLRIDHPDIEEFIDAKRDGGKLTNFNISVLVTDDFMKAVETDGYWELKFNGKVFKTVEALALWEKIMRSTYECADPGVIFIDRVNAQNPLSHVEKIYATNPCGEQPLPPYGACLLGSINLTRLIRDPFMSTAYLDEQRLREVTAVAVRFLDNVIDVSNYPLPQQKQEAFNKRRIGLGITGLADALAMCGSRYGSEQAQKTAAAIMSNIEQTALHTSIELAKEKGPYPFWLSERDGPKRRNSHLISVAPTGTISLFAGNVSSGIEPIFDLKAKRKVRQLDGSYQERDTEDYAYRLYNHHYPEAGPAVPFVTASELQPMEHLDMVAAVQRHVDSGVSKTINCPADISYGAFKTIYLHAYALGLKGCTTYRPNQITGSILSSDTMKIEKPAYEKVAEEFEKEKALEKSQVRIELGTKAIDKKLAAAILGSAQDQKPAPRPRELPGVTYKIKPGEHALYITICDHEVDGRRRPYEIFFNSKQVDGFDWMIALSRMLSAIFRKGGDIEFVVEELHSVFSPRGGFWAAGKYQQSICAAIGDVLHEHMLKIGFVEPAEDVFYPPADPVLTGTEWGPAEYDRMKGRAPHSLGAAAVQVQARFCPKCQVGVLHRREGCMVCGSCDYSKC